LLESLLIHRSAGPQRIKVNVIDTLGKQASKSPSSNSVRNLLQYCQSLGLRKVDVSKRMLEVLLCLIIGLEIPARLSTQQFRSAVPLNGSSTRSKIQV